MHRLPASRGEEVEVLQPGEVAVEGNVLGQEGDALLGFQRILHDVDAVDHRRPLRGIDEPQDQVDRRRLARPVGPEEGEQLPSAYGQVEVVEGQHPVLVTLRQVDGLQHWLCLTPLRVNCVSRCKTRAGMRLIAITDREARACVVCSQIRGNRPTG